MKKYLVLIIFLSIFMTGCFNNTLTEVCSKKEDANYIEEIDKIEFTHLNGKINYLKLSKEYIGMDMTGALKTYLVMYQNEPGVNVDVSNNTITYEFEMDNVKDDIKDIFNLKDNYHDQINTLKEMGFTCE